MNMLLSNFTDFLYANWWIFAVVIIALMVLIIFSTMIPQLNKRRNQTPVQAKTEPAITPVQEAPVKSRAVKTKKSTVVAKTNVTEEASKPTTSKRGRPAKAKPAEVKPVEAKTTAITTETKQENNTTAKRGRPAKAKPAEVKPIEVKATAVKPEAKQETNTVAKRGRPAKATPNEAKPTPSDVTAPAAVNVVKTENKEEASQNYVVSYNDDLKNWIVIKENGKRTLFKSKLKAEAINFAKERATAVGGIVISQKKNTTNE